MKVALLSTCYLALLMILCAGFTARNPLYVVDVLLIVSVTALFAALILAVWQDLHPRR
jgi:hypothetical protein